MYKKLPEFIVEIANAHDGSLNKMMQLIQSSIAVITDSGGLQKECFFFQVPCITIRNETEWEETVDLGCNFIVGTSYEKLNNALNMVKKFNKFKKIKSPYGDGNAARKIVDIIIKYLGKN